MNFLKNIFSKKVNTPDSYTYKDFWEWFANNEKNFFSTVKSRENIESNFFDKLAHELNKLGNSYYFLTGMKNEHTAELIFTPDGSIKDIVFVEELVEAAPVLDNWKFIALKPDTHIEDMSIRMGDYEFSKENLFFYPIEHAQYPDEVDIVIVYEQYADNDKQQIISGVYIFLDNYLGELNSLTTIDHLTVTGRDNVEKELIPIAKLKDYLIWREKEFVEGYQGIWRHTDKDRYTMFGATIASGNDLLATINTDILKWDKKASHPWMATLNIKYNPSNKGFPTKADYEVLNSIEDEVIELLQDKDGYIYIGRQIAEGEKEIFFACKDFRKPSKVFYEIQQKYKHKHEIIFDMYKDKYWQYFNRFIQN